MFVAAFVTGVGVNAFSNAPRLFASYSYNPGAPSAPLGVTAEPGDASITVTWQPPTSEGTCAVTGYTVWVRSGGQTVLTDTVGATTFSDVIGGLTNGTTYDASVSAFNCTASGDESAPVPVVPSTVAGPPTIDSLTTTACVASIVVTWSPPVDDGGAAITGFHITATSGPSHVTKTAGSSATSVTFTSLKHSTLYSVVVEADNANGPGAPSPAMEQTVPAACGGGGGGTDGSGPPPTGDAVQRVGGTTRIETAVLTSRAAFADGAADAVVLARADTFPDALTGVPLAAAEHAPLLLTPTSSLDPATRAEIQRVLPAGGTVHLLGGSAALDRSIDDELTALGYVPVRHEGVDRYATAVAIAHALDDPATVLLATGRDFPDALSAGAAAASVDGAVLLTEGDVLGSETASYLASHPVTTLVAVGGDAADAAPSAIALDGADRYETATLVASHFFTAPAVAGLATGTTFADALAGSAVVGARGGPMLFTDPVSLSAPTSQYLGDHRDDLSEVLLFGGTGAISPAVEQQVVNVLA